MLGLGLKVYLFSCQDGKRNELTATGSKYAQEGYSAQVLHMTLWRVQMTSMATWLLVKLSVPAHHRNHIRENFFLFEDL